MDYVSTKINKSEEDEINREELLEENKQSSEVMDTSIFDDTLKEIDQILINLEQKIEIEEGQLEKLDVLPKIKSAISKIHVAKNKLTIEENNLVKNNNLIKRIEDLEKNINNLNKPILLSDEFKKEDINEIEEHKIDQNILSTNELHGVDEKKKKNFFGFYSYVILTIIIFFALYGLLNISRDFIILKYPITEPYIQYFYEIIEILKITVLNLSGFTKNEI